jgi:GNAT superfamily N-acetyltransferase
MSLPTNITIKNSCLEYAQQVVETVRLAYGVGPAERCIHCLDLQSVTEQLQRFPEGQFMAVHHGPEGDLVAGIAATMRVSGPADNPPKTWMEKIGTMGISHHDPNGEWLYGVEMAVRPDFRKQGVGTALYEARFDLVKRLNLRGWYAGGMLMGYHRYVGQMTVREYGEKVMRREMIDPTVTMQMNRGFEPHGLIDNYLDEGVAGNTAVLIVWENPDYQES